MLFFTTIKIALKSLYANKMRSVLAMLGIIIGVSAVISMLAIGAGSKKSVMERIGQMGTNLLVVRAGQHGQMGVRGGDVETLTLDDARAVLSKINSVIRVAPVVNGNAQLKYFNRNSRASVMGTAVTFPFIRSFEVEYGRFFNESETESMARVAVIGPQTAEDLGFTKQNLGERIKLKGINFKVVGILKSKGDQGFFNPDDQAIIPYTTAMNIVFGSDSVREIDVQTAPGADMLVAQTEIEALLRKRHRIAADDEDDFNVRNQAEIIQMATEFSKTFTVLLGGIASISLLVGGIGIMNIMLVTVTERTREIGIRKAIGARNGDILRQFLIESLIMSLSGGLIGAIIGVMTARIINANSDFTTVVEPKSILLALGFSIGVGVFFGYYPALRAAKLDPIQCLYYE